jgi:hypothetical protein
MRDFELNKVENVRRKNTAPAFAQLFFLDVTHVFSTPALTVPTRAIAHLRTSVTDLQSNIVEMLQQADDFSYMSALELYNSSCELLNSFFSPSTHLAVSSLSQLQRPIVQAR